LQHSSSPSPVIANALRSPHVRIINDGYYQNEEGVWGYSVTVWEAGRYHMISVSHTERPPTLDDIADALISPDAYVQSDGRYPNRKGSVGYYATIKSGDHWYMVFVS
jgi:hypothetical protein